MTTKKTNRGNLAFSVFLELYHHSIILFYDEWYSAFGLSLASNMVSPQIIIITTNYNLSIAVDIIISDNIAEFLNFI